MKFPRSSSAAFTPARWMEVAATAAQTGAGDDAQALDDALARVPAAAADLAAKVERLHPSATLKAWAPQPKDEKPTPPKDPKAAALDKELADFQRDVTLGNWPAVKKYLAALPDEEAVAAYRQLLQNLRQPPGMGRGGRGGPVEPEMIETPDGQRYFTIARTVARAASPRAVEDAELAIGLGCELKNAERLVYARDAEPNRARLPTHAATNHMHLEVERGGHLDDLHRRANRHHVRLAAKVGLRVLPVDHDAPAPTGIDAHTGDGGLAPPRAIEVGSSHLRQGRPPSNPLISRSRPSEAEAAIIL